MPDGRPEGDGVHIEIIDKLFDAFRRGANSGDRIVNIEIRTHAAIEVVCAQFRRSEGPGSVRP